MNALIVRVILLLKKRRDMKMTNVLARATDAELEVASKLREYSNI